MINIQNKQLCCGCNACVQRCPKQCISMLEDSEGFLYPEVDKTLCIDCGLCEKVCPVINQGSIREPLEVYAAKHPNEEIRLQSSSGGIFTMLAERVIDKGGVVFGAAFNQEWEVEHQYTDKKDGLAAFRGSKYVQSKIGETYKQAEAFLKQGREVLFSGTPCQIRGLKLFLRKEYGNLLTVDFICHGVPSPGVFRSYLKEEKEKLAHQREEKNSVSSSIIPLSERDSLVVNTDDVEIEAISFRDKAKGWKKYSFVLVLSKVSAEGEKNTVSSSYIAQQNPYMYGFLSNVYLRPSCHSCPTRNLKSQSDITLGDFWNVENWSPEVFDDKGCSAVLINTKKGLESVDKEQFLLSDYTTVLQGNPSLINDTIRPVQSRRFWKMFKTYTCFSMSYETTRLTNMDRLLNKINKYWIKLKKGISR